MAAIKNIIFDLGGVLLDIDYYKTADAFKALGVKHFDDYYSQADANDLFESLETGKITEEVFYTTMQQFCSPGTDHEQIQTAWNAMLLSFRKESLEYLTALKSRYRLFLLSNTNSIHHTAFIEKFEKEIGGTSFDGCFTKTWYSHLIHRRKPYPETYQFVLEDAGLNGEETFFVDDSYKNIEGAKQAGLHTHFLQGNERIEMLNIW